MLTHARIHERLVATTSLAIAATGLVLLAQGGARPTLVPAASAAVSTTHRVPEDVVEPETSSASLHDSRRVAAAFSDDRRRVAPDLGTVPPFSGPVWSTDDLPSYADRRVATPASPHYPPPTSGEFQATVETVPAAVLARSTWRPECPVAVADLRYVTVTHVGFDGLAHTGELLVHRLAAEGFVEVFRDLYEDRYPIERMWVTSMAELEERDWTHGIDNNTGAFVCRGSVASDKWSEHARGLAVDVNPYHNPYVKGERVVPPHAGSYLVRDDRPGIIHDHDVVVTGFARMGWTWGGNWSSALDYMHFSHNDH